MRIDEERRQEYNEYMNSPAWKRFREAAIKQADCRCQSCGVSKWSVTLEVHHLTYERFKHERLSDVQVLCPKCHKIADGVREDQTRERNYQKLENARFDGWARKVYGEGWTDHVNADSAGAWERFDAWRESKGD